MTATEDQNSEPFLVNSFGDRYFYSINRGSFDKLGSFAVYREFFGKDFPKANTFYVISGTDSGLLPKYLLQLGLPEGTKVLFVELDEVLPRIAAELEQETHPHLFLTTLEGLAEKLYELGCNEYVWADSAEKRRSLCASDAFLATYIELDQATQQVFANMVFQIRNSLGNKLFWIRQLENLAENQHGATCLQGLFPGKTGVLLGIGPSLHEVIPWVKDNRDNLVVLAVSRAAKALADAGLTPDLFLSIDPKELSFDVSRDMLPFWQDTIFVHAHHASPPLVAQWRGRRLYVGSRLFWPTPLNEKMFHYAGPTVTQWGVSVALEMGFSQLVLGGVDLCFGREGQHYAQGETRGVGFKLGDIRNGVETNGGWLAESCVPYATGAKVLEWQAGQALGRGCRIINPAAGAMKIANVAFVPLAELAVAPLSCPARQTLTAALPEDSREARLAHYQAMREELQRVSGQLAQMQEIAASALKSLKLLFAKKGKLGHLKHKRSLDKLERQLKSEFSDLVSVVQSHGVLRFLKVLKGNTADRDDLSPEEMCTTWQTYYQAYRDSCQDLIDLLGKAEARLEARMVEESPGPDFSLLAGQWQQDLQYGRYQLWLDRYPDGQGAFAGAGEILDPLMVKFERIMSYEEHLSSEFVKSQESLAEKKAKARFLFSIQDQRGLGILQRGLSADPLSKDAGLQALVHGYLCELSGKVEEALGAYEQLINDNCQDLLEDALLRVVALGLEHQDLSNATLALECLAGFSLAYAPKYGDLLWILGQRAEALDVYADYLEQMPRDIQSYLRLGRYYQELELPEGARTVYRHVLELDPGHRTAGELLAALA